MRSYLIPVTVMMGIACGLAAAGQSGQSGPGKAGQRPKSSPAAHAYDGSWSGATALEKAVSFEVTNGKITSFSAQGLITGRGCSSESGTTATVSQPITGGAFSVGAPGGPGGVSLSVQGKFLSPTKACGILRMQLHGIPGPPPGVPGHVPSCSGEMETGWQARRGEAARFDAALDCPGLTVQTPAPEPPPPPLGRTPTEPRAKPDGYFISNLACGEPAGSVQLGRRLKCQVTVERGSHAPGSNVFVELYWSDPSGMITNFGSVDRLPSPGLEAEVAFQINVFSRADLVRNLDMKARFAGKPQPMLSELTAVARVVQPTPADRDILSNEVSTVLKIVGE